MTTLLNGYRVLDLGRFIAGPYCAALLGQFGADVIRIERPGGNEDRGLVPITTQGDGALFMQVNSNKRGMTLDLRQPAGRKILQQLIATADVVVANMPPRALNALGLDYDALKAIKPDIILAANSTFGNQTEQADIVGFDGVAQAMSGAIYFSGEPNRPVKTSVQYIDFSTAISSALGVMAAILHRERTGEGQVVETALLATALTISSGMLAEQSVTQANRVPSGNQAQLAAPADLFETQDGHLIAQIVGPYIFKRWTRLVDAADWLDDERFHDDQARGDHKAILNERMAEWCHKRTTAEAIAELEAARIPAGAVLTFQEALDHPYIQALHHLNPLPFPGTPTPPPTTNPPVSLSATPAKVTQRAPLTGEHTESILESLGYDAAQIEAFRAQSLI